MLIDILVKIVFGLLAPIFVCMATIVIISMARVALEERRQKRNVHSVSEHRH